MIHEQPPADSVVDIEIFSKETPRYLFLSTQRVAAGHVVNTGWLLFILLLKLLLKLLLLFLFLLLFMMVRMVMTSLGLRLTSSPPPMKGLSARKSGGTRLGLAVVTRALVLSLLVSTLFMIDQELCNQDVPIS